jgi:plasmid stabilization system protein ParE
MAIIGADELQRKPVKTNGRCEKMLDEAIRFIEQDSPQQAEIMRIQFFKVMRLLEIMPGIGSKYKKGMRKFLLGKFPYYVYYKEMANYTKIVGIWHTSRGTDFEEP